MRTAVDTNVISALWSGEPSASEMAQHLGVAQQSGGLVICAPVYAELLAHPKATNAFADEFLSEVHIQVDFAMDEAVWRETARAFSEYSQRWRESGGAEPKRLLVDFIVGAHSLLQADRLLTLDGKRYTQAFPALKLMPMASRSH